MAKTSKKHKQALAAVDREKAYPGYTPPPAPKPWWQFWKTSTENTIENQQASTNIDVSEKSSNKID